MMSEEAAEPVLSEPAPEEDDRVVIDADEKVMMPEEKTSLMASDDAPFYASVDISMGADYALDDMFATADTYESYIPYLEVSVGLNNIVSYGKWGMGVDFSADIMAYMLQDTVTADPDAQFDYMDNTFRVSFTPMLQYQAGKAEFEIGPTVNLNITKDADDDPSSYIASEIVTDYSDDTIALGYGLHLGMDYRLTDDFYVTMKVNGLHASNSLDLADGWSVGGSLGLGYSF
jgi:hypothetical protein